MKLTDVTLSFPYLNYRMKITHFSARVSTAIEWVILEAINKIEQNPNTEYAKYSVDLFFSQIFLIGIEGDSNLLLKPCIFSLLDRNAITTDQDLSDETDLRDFPISALRLTDIGREMQKKGLLPGEDSDIQYSILYDCLKKEIKSVKDRDNLSSDSSGIVISEDEDNLINMPLPVTSVKDYLLERQKHQQTAPSWLQPTTEIKEIVLDNANDENPVSVLWSNKTYAVNCSEDMKISIGSFPDKSISDFVLEDLEKKDSRDLINSSKVPAILIKNIDSEVNKLSTIDDIVDILVDLMDKDKIFFINNELIDFDIDSILADESAKICFIFDDSEFSIENTKNLVIRLPETNSNIIKSNVLYGNKSDSIYLGKFNLKSETASKNVFLCYSPKNQFEDIVNIIHFVINKYLSEAHFELMYLYLVVNENDKFNTTFDSLLNSKNSYKDKLSLIDQVFKKITQLLLPHNLSKTDFYLSQIKWKSDKEHEVDEIIKIIDEIRNNYTFKEAGNLTEKALNKVFESWNSCSDLDSLWKVLEKSKIDGNIVGWLKTTQSVKKLFSDEILIQILNRYESNEFIRIPQYTRFEEILVNLKRNQIEINDVLKPLNIPTDLSQESLKNTILRSRFNLSKLRELIKKHDELIGNLNKYLVERRELIKNTSISSVDSLPKVEFFSKTETEIRIIGDTILEFYNESALRYDRIYVVDTCALMNTPELVDKFISNKSALIVPKKVIEELNRNKDFTHDSEKSSKAQTAISYLNKYDQTKAPWFIIEESHPELLPLEYPTTVKDKSQEKEVTDNLILSVILKYKVRKAILITDDKNLQLKASSEKISYQSSDRFLSSK